MKYKLILLRLYYATLSVIAPTYAAKKAFTLFQTVRIKSIKKREQVLYETAKHFKVPYNNESLNCYELGNPDGTLVFLVHGWDSNAGSLSKFALELAQNNYRVISFDLPAHAHSKSRYTNLYDCKEALLCLIKFINPQSSFSVISHSFGSAVTTMALSNTHYKVDNLVFLTTPNSIINIFTEFKSFINLGNSAFEIMLKTIGYLLGKDIKELNIQDNIKTVSYNNLLLIHDKYDKVLPYKNAKDVATHTKNATLASFEKIGHYRMLWNQDVVDTTLNFLKRKSLKKVNPVL